MMSFQPSPDGGPSDDAMEWLTDALEQRSFNKGTIKVLLELLVCEVSIQSAQIYQAVKKDQQMQLEMQHYRGDLSLETFAAIDQSVYSCFNRQTTCYYSEEHGLNPLPAHCDRRREPALGRATHLMLPMRINNTCIGVVMLAIEPNSLERISIAWIKMINAIIAQCISSSLLPNFITLYARPYQRVEADEVNRIQSALQQCNGNKTMAAKVLGMTPRQLRYRLEKQFA